MPNAVVNFVLVPIYFISAHVGVNVMDGGMIGAALAVAFAYVFHFIIFVAVSFALGNHKKTWHAPSWNEIFVRSRWMTLLKQWVPAGIAGIFEQLQMQAVTLIVAQVSETLA